MIEVEHLTKEFGPIDAVSDISFSVAKGEILGFLGPNGAGKTTTMRMLAGIFPPTRGKATVAGFDLRENVMEVRRRIGYLPEQIPLYPELTVSEYLSFVASIWGYGRKDREKNLAKSLEQCGLTEMRDALIGRLSRGYKQRLGLAQALIHDPEVLILDEPTVGLDPKQIREIRDLIKSFQGNKTVILSTHILPEVEMTCQKVVIINLGKIVAQGTPESLTRPSGSQIELEIEGPADQISEALSSVPGIDRLKKLSESGKRTRFLLDTKNGVEMRPQIVRAIVEHRWDLLELHMHSVTLEDIFVKLVTKEQT